MTERRRISLGRRLWGIDPAEVETLLVEQVAPQQQEWTALEQILATLESEEQQLNAELADLTERVNQARERVATLQNRLEQQRTTQRVHSLSLARELARREQEHSANLLQLDRQAETLRQEIEERRKSLHAWAMELLASVAARGKL